MASKTIGSRAARLVRRAEKLHIGLFRCAPTLPAVAGRTGGDKVCPAMGAAGMAGYNMVDGQLVAWAPAILAGVVIATQHLSLAQGHARSRTLDQVLQFDDRGQVKLGGSAADFATSVENQLRLARHQEGERPLHIADMKRLKVNIENEYWFFQ